MLNSPKKFYILYLALCLLEIYFLSNPSRADSYIHRPTLRFGQVAYTGKRAIRKYHQEIMGQPGVPKGQVIWPRWNFLFEPKTLWSPTLGLGVGFQRIFGSTRTEYQSGSFYEVSAQESIFELGLQLGFKPGVTWARFYTELGFGLGFGEEITISSPFASRSTSDRGRAFAGPSYSLGLSLEVLSRIYLEVTTQQSLVQSHDDYYTGGVGFAF